MRHARVTPLCVVRRWTRTRLQVRDSLSVRQQLLFSQLYWRSCDLWQTQSFVWRRVCFLAADGTPCAGSGMIRVPGETISWTSGECMPCPSNPDQWGYPFFFCNGTDDHFSQTLLAQGISPRYTKVACTVNGTGATIEHFSDATCTAANKVSGAELDSALTAALWSSFVETPSLTLANVGARVEMPGLEQCLTPNITAGPSFSDISIADRHCAHLTVTAYDEVRIA